MKVKKFELPILFGEAARGVAKQILFTYDENEEKGIENYLKQVKNGLIEY